MPKIISRKRKPTDGGKKAIRKPSNGYSALSRQILRYANRGVLRIDFLAEVSRWILDASECDQVEIRLKERNRHFRSVSSGLNPNDFSLDVVPGLEKDFSRIFPSPEAVGDYERLCHDLVLGRRHNNWATFTAGGSFFAGDTSRIDSSLIGFDGKKIRLKKIHHGDFYSLTIIPFKIEGDHNNLLIMRSCRRGFFNRSKVVALEGLAQNLGVALVHRHIQVALRERVKELTCLYGIAKIMARPDISIPEILQRTVDILPPAWLYPDIARARITVDGQSFMTSDFSDNRQKLTALIKVGETERGLVEVVYIESRPPLDEGPFLKEERHLIDTVAEEIALIIERRQVEEDKLRLQEQLRHADRLATIGQLAAGVAHELNEPLGSILGFAQLILKEPTLTIVIEQDLHKIVNASLHAREVIKKLMVFARQMPPRKTRVNLNQVVEEGIYFLESRCLKAGIELIRQFSPDLPEIVADPTQLHQVLINLVVNSIQAMPQGGQLTIATAADNGNLKLSIIDTGSGMSPEVLSKIFVPFFTTKDLHEGTGLGLPVVHGIVTAHGGTIQVFSREGEGSRFEILLPVVPPDSIEESDENGSGDE